MHVIKIMQFEWLAALESFWYQKNRTSFYSTAL